MSLILIAVQMHDMVLSRYPPISVGMSVNLICQSYQEVEWFFNQDEDMPANTRPMKSLNILHISEVTLDNGGYYYCYGFDETTFVSELLVKIYGK